MSITGWDVIGWLIIALLVGIVLARILGFESNAIFTKTRKDAHPWQERKNGWKPNRLFRKRPAMPEWR